MSPAPAGVRVVGSGAPKPDELDAAVPPAGADTPDEIVDQPAPRRPPALMVVFAVIALLGVFGTVFYWSKYRTLSHRGDAQRTVEQVAQQFLVDLTNFQANNVDAQFAKVTALSTGGFAQQFQQYLSGQNPVPSLEKAQAASRGQVRSLYVETLSSDRATVFAVVDQVIASAKIKPETDQDMMELTLQKGGAGWRISDVTVLQGPVVPSATK